MGIEMLTSAKCHNCESRKSIARTKTKKSKKLHIKLRKIDDYDKKLGQIKVVQYTGCSDEGTETPLSATIGQSYSV